MRWHEKVYYWAVTLNKKYYCAICSKGLKFRRQAGKSSTYFTLRCDHENDLCFIRCFIPNMKPYNFYVRCDNWYFETFKNGVLAVAYNDGWGPIWETYAPLTSIILTKSQIDELIAHYKIVMMFQ